ncbi:MAG: class I SAM-dependent methyltransferase [Candidatus Hodarchaeota archaeon]
MKDMLLRILDTPAGELYDQQIESYNKYMYQEVLRFPELIDKISELGINVDYLKRYQVYMQWAIRKLEYSFVIDHLPKTGGLKILDVGSGASIFPHILSRMGHKVDALDPEQNWLLANTEIGDLYNKFFSSDVEYKNNYVQEIEQKYCYDAVISISVLEHLSKRKIKNTVKKMSSLIKQSGHLILTIDYSPRAKHYSKYIFVDRTVRKLLVLTKLASIPYLGFSYEDFLYYIYPYLNGRANIDKLLAEDRNAISFEEFWRSHFFERCMYDDYRPYLSLGISVRKQQQG